MAKTTRSGRYFKLAGETINPGIYLNGLGQFAIIENISINNEEVIPIVISDDIAYVAEDKLVKQISCWIYLGEE